MKTNFTTELNKKIVDAFLEQLKSKRNFKWIDNRKKLFYEFDCTSDSSFVNRLMIDLELTVEDLVTGNYILDIDK